LTNVCQILAGEAISNGGGGVVGASIRPALAAAVGTTTMVFRGTFNDTEEDGEEAEGEKEAEAETEGREEEEGGEEVDKALDPHHQLPQYITNQELARRGLRQ
jgi:Sec-independent protein translocase protein TatA